MSDRLNSRNNSILTTSPPAQSLSPHDFQLKIKRIIGTSAADKQQISIQDNLVAYTASGGVVVCKIDKETNSVVSQRFFCANSNESKLQSLQSGVSSANAYLNMIKTDCTSEEVIRDEYGYPITSQPIEMYGNSFPPNEFDDNFNNNVCPSPGINNQSSPSKLKDKVRSIKCITLSPNKRLLAIGESGYQPRILIFSLASNSQQSPIMAIYEHTFGINNLVFSPDSRLLCSLGVVNDGCINVWKLGSNHIQLQASNRCSNIIHKVIWHENTIVTIGLRFIKLWKFDSGNTNKPVVLKGRNAHLGNFMNSIFIDMTLINEDELVLIANGNQLLLLKLNFDPPKLVALKTPDYGFCSIAADLQDELIWLGDSNTNLESFNIADLTPIEVNNVRPASSPPSIGSNSLQQQLSGVFGMETSQAPSSTIVQLSNFSRDYLLYSTKNEEIMLWNKESGRNQPLATSIIRQISGVKKSNEKEYLVFSKTGTVEQFHPNSCELTEIFQFKAPETEVVADCLTALEKVGNLFILGYKFGSLFIVEQNEVLFTIKAHSSTINEIVYFTHDTYDLICSISRDRMIQIFAKVDSKWDLLQTIPVHNGNLLKAIYHNGFLYVCSTDRTISIHSIATDPSLMMTKVKSLTLKSTPITMSIFDHDLVVSTSDKQLLVFDLENNCEFKRSMKLINDKLNESLQVEMMERFHNLLIVWSSDKSIRGFDYVTGKAVGVSWGHSDSLLGFFLIQTDTDDGDEDTELVTIGNDGCLFSWRVTVSSTVRTVSNEENGKMFDEVVGYSPSPVHTKVARKILPTVPNSAVPSNVISSSSPPKKEKLIDKLEQAATGLRPKVALSTSSSSSSPIPQSPTRKLTAATLKRIESRNGRKEETGGNSPCASPKSYMSPTRSKSVSPIRPSVKSRPSSPTRSLTTANKRQSQRQSQSQSQSQSQAVNGGGLLSKLNEPLVNSSSSPPKRLLSSSRATSDPFVRDKQQISPFDSSVSSTFDLKTDENVSQAPTIPLVEKCMDQFNELISRVEELQDHERATLLSKINEVRYILDDDSNAMLLRNQDDLLNKYSDKLVELVEAKLSGSSISE
ncbi:hypothetical protein CORT_0E05290 [Candida orthopsilosis Co 90-125]|uniref:Uncharacterized protein n=1 Tax=Candida orthopsilosis (strain 90-125) TaxID=1136231 RepID=H8X815_CANO9|nr:hypothetical protein CORT_0E05290 [Candida orthopsilosis Co 90-125]CCG24114.1 hypothetical protein CORT_0E05290 [Candida orthopsilosis Co 90-125]